jgi:hypothetical protein
MHTTSCLVCLAVLWVGLAPAVWAQTLPFGISLPPSLNFATSPSPVGSGARAVGKGTAFIAVADDATAASHNPGGLIQLQTPEVSVVGSYYVRSEIQDVTVADTMVADQTLDRFDLNYLSLAYPFEFLRRNVVVSLNVQRLFDLQSATDVVSRYNTVDGVQPGPTSLVTAGNRPSRSVARDLWPVAIALCRLCQPAVSRKSLILRDLM